MSYNMIDDVLGALLSVRIETIINSNKDIMFYEITQNAEVR